MGLGPGGGGWFVDYDGGCGVAHETVRNAPGTVPDGMRRNPARFVWSITTLVFAALAVGPTLWLGLATPDCAPSDHPACSFGQALGIALALWVGVVIFGPLTLGSAILWMTRKKYLPEAGDE